MSINGFHTLSIGLQLAERHFIKIPIPIRLSVFEELLDSFLDILNIICFWAPKTDARISGSSLSIHSTRALVIAILTLLDSLNIDEPYDLIDVSTDKVRVLIKVR
ncbi:hypothetical protein [Acetobacterium woodii]|uniref:Uncharacterized protein n=1 Tax=Acetobacterium woodii (strain ATCC 29683 / DSM 1030 / JCM 2381 / KCTC 1655 / WB1) TaxID=931626 RepID=H6LKZ7_ACEWD|nr:hypothetical protein [Acetobacterium woodii]AFA50106.1 hypothetical protein Awo_c33780 [Acetobacterium woodii DSM 1030]